MYQNMKHYTLLLILLLTGYSAVAQLMQFQQGKKLFMEGDYQKSLDYFNQAISQERSGNRELLAEAYYLRGMNYIRLYGEAFSGDNATLQKRYADALLSAYNDFISCLKYDNGQYWQRIDNEMKNLHQPLLQEGLKSLNEYNDLVFNGITDKNLLKRAEDYLTAAHDIRDSYLVNDLLGQIALDKGQNEEAGKFFSRAEKLYTENLPDEPDFLMAYVFYRQAAIHKTTDIRKALDDARRGLRIMESEYERFSRMKYDMAPPRIMELEDQYRLAMQDLNSLTLDLHLSAPEMYVEALDVFEKELAEEPDNVNVLIGYASLLEKTDKQKAIGIYEKVLALEADNEVVLFNLGVLHYSRGKEMFDLAQNTSDNDQFSILLEEATRSFDIARPYFKEVLALDPRSLDAVQALKIIAFVLDEKEDYLKYQAMEKDLGR